jgi:hypothetical protein
MKIYTDRITLLEREHLTSLAVALRSIAAHELSRQLAATLDQWANTPAGQVLDTATLNQSAEQAQATWDRMSSHEQHTYRAEFFAASECRFAARGVGMRAPLSFSDNVADANRALNAA